jgi:hypothetical protein
MLHTHRVRHGVEDTERARQVRDPGKRQCSHHYIHTCAGPENAELQAVPVGRTAAIDKAKAKNQKPKKSGAAGRRVRTA